MQRLKNLLPRQFFGYLDFFRGYLGNTVFIALAASILVAVLDGIGLTMFLPLLQLGAQGGEAGSDMGEMSVILDTIISLGVPLTVTSVLLLMLLFFGLKGIAKFASSYYTVRQQQRFMTRLRIRNLDLLAGYDYRAFTTADSGRIQNTFSGEVERLNAAHHNYFQMLQQAIICLVYVGMAYLANPRFALIVGVGGLLSNLLFSRIYKVTEQSSRKMTTEAHRFQGYLVQSVSNYKFLKATDLIGRYRQRIAAVIRSLENEQRRVGTMHAIATAAREPLILLIVVAGILIQINFFADSLASILLSLLFFYRGLTNLVATQSNYNSFLGTAGSIENMRSFSRELAAHQEKCGGRVVGPLRTGLTVSHLHYGFADADLLRDLDLTIRKNETLGIVGESGTGKTTFVNILSGLLHVPAGMFSIDGHDSNAIDLAAYRRRIGYVTQEPPVFMDTVFNNVSFWDDQSPETEARVWHALELAHAADFVQELPGRLQARIGINGVNLSGGQRQRLAIARELYRDIDILVLDEATSALDTRSENLIRQNIESLAGSYTMIVIAHRLSTIRNADKILYLKPGQEYEIGSFQELCYTSATFGKLVSLQNVA